MVFNILSGLLIYKNYQYNSTNTYVTYDVYVYSWIEVAFSCIVMLSIILRLEFYNTNKQDKIKYFCLIIIQIFNYAYSLIIGNSYNAQDLVTKSLSRMSLAIIIINSLTYICLFYHIEKYKNQIQNQPKNQTRDRQDQVQVQDQDQEQNIQTAVPVVVPVAATAHVSLFRSSGSRDLNGTSWISQI
jgi:hypothetical protein